MYQIAICDDEKIFTDKLAHMIKQYLLPAAAPSAES